MKTPLNILRKTGRALAVAMVTGSFASIANAEVDLVAWWPLDEVGATTTPDKSGNGLDLTLEGDIDGDSLTAGKFDMAIEFDGFDDMLTRISDPGDALPISQHESYTISLWVNGEFDLQEGDRRVFSEGSDTSNDPLLNIGTKNDGADATVDIFFRNGGSPGHQFSLNDGFDGEWHHIALIREGEIANLYIDGELNTELTFQDPYSESSNTTSVGGILRAAPSHWFTGLIDDVAVFRSALNQSELDALIEGTLLPGLVADDDGDGLPDAWEALYGVDDPTADDDGDGSINEDEFERGTIPNKADTDEDGYNDGAETGTGTWVGLTNTGTDPLNDDTDGDGLKDGVETNTGVFVSEEDPGTSPLLADSDGDGASDSAEIANGTDPTNEDDTPDALGFLVGWWPLDEVNGSTTPDMSGNDYHMQMENMDISNLVPGKLGAAMEFDGVDEMLTFVSDEDQKLPITQYEQYTIGLWVKGAFDGQVGGGDRRVFSEGSEFDNNPLLNIGTHNGGADATVDIYLRNGGGPPHMHSFNDGFDDEWHHIAFIRDGEEMSLYIDGVLDDLFVEFWDPYSPDVTNTTSIGGILRGSPSHWFTGLIDDVAVFNTVLTEEQITKLKDGELLVGGPADADGDGMLDSWEEFHGVDDPNADADGDTLTNKTEHDNQTNPKKADTDEDGYNDNVETGTGNFVDLGNTGTDPLVADTDDDGLTDGVETNTGTFVSETNTGTDPNNPDTDDDGLNDGAEISGGTDPFVPDNEPKMIAYWPLETIIGDKTPDLSGNGFDLEATNMTEDDNVVEGKVGNAMQFSRFDETLLSYISEEGELLPITQFEQFTISLWVNASFEEQEANDLRVFF